MQETVSTADIFVSEGSAAGRGGRFAHYGTLKQVSIDSNPGDGLEETFQGTFVFKGRGRTTITFESVIPLAGKTIDFVEMGMVRHATVRVVCVIANKKRTYEGIVANNSESFGLGKSAMDNVKLECAEPKYENL